MIGRLFGFPTTSSHSVVTNCQSEMNAWGRKVVSMTSTLQYVEKFSKMHAFMIIPELNRMDFYCIGQGADISGCKFVRSIICCMTQSGMKNPTPWLSTSVQLAKKFHAAKYQGNVFLYRPKPLEKLP